jgi:hypothetical protein
MAVIPKLNDIAAVQTKRAELDARQLRGKTLKDAQEQTLKTFEAMNNAEKDAALKVLLIHFGLAEPS